MRGGGVGGGVSSDLNIAAPPKKTTNKIFGEWESGCPVRTHTGLI